MFEPVITWSHHTLNEADTLSIIYRDIEKVVTMATEIKFRRKTSLTPLFSSITTHGDQNEMFQGLINHDVMEIRNIKLVGVLAT